MKRGEALLSSVVRSAADAIIGCDAQGRITAWNPAAERIYGYHCDEVRRRPVTMMYPTDVFERDWQVFQKALRGTPTGQHRTVRLRKDGTRVPVRMSFAPIEGVDGSVRGVVSVAHELTDEIRSEARMVAVLQATPDPIIGVDRDGRIVFANASCERLLGYHQDELIGRHARTLFAEEDRADLVELRERLFTDPRLRDETRTLRTRMLRKDGTVLPGETRLSWQDEPGGPLLVAATRDLSELHRAEERLRALLETVPDAITGISPDGLIVLVNQGTERLLGYPRDQLLGQPYARLIPEEERGRVAGMVAEVFAAAEPRMVIYTEAIRSDGVRVPTENTVTRFDTMLLVVGRDITDRVLAERERAQRLASLGQLAGGVAHDFNNLLAIISNYADLLGEEVNELAGADPDRWQPVADDLTRIQQAAQRGAALTQQLLTFSRRDLNRPRVLEPGVILRQLRPALRATADDRIDLDLDVAPDTWPVLLDPGQLEQILVNLCTNAAEAMPDGGRLRITADNLRPARADPSFQPAAEEGRRYLRLRVADTGAGMSVETSARAFEPFFTTKAKGTGTGLGLAAVHGIVGQAGGCLAIDSAPGAGTTMTVLLPAVDEKSAAVGVGGSPAGGSPGDGSSAGGSSAGDSLAGGSVAGGSAAGGFPAASADVPRPRVILLADDEDEIRESTARILDHHGFRVLTAHDGPSALAVAEQHRDEIDVLLTDVIMPRMHGGELAARVAELIPGVRVIYMSGYAEPLLDTEPSYAAAPMLEKPFTTANLLRILG
ncbi:putative multi-sensor signal transduction histidine kinase [Actinoplanes missouriensis 431]|uniref:histidine kinase n=1 Tax=Actinoplanes missouriensis (strain ATCC 14538 / DSM 43046 / CBS 188.64 / JCM 3121 / NBRC 102363 / NCIMB 12654 / NRRL B-3342 / UNCC 431) TaxID=512565 RepID=I0H6A1_ACTM4|nr:PAS domain S-box protein [Actinoplanes missouriensis]BAL88538.1 putative multi-sensor signal transduction histidine kinase [Actinoplanes missouriensis 431]